MKIALFKRLGDHSYETIKGPEWEGIGFDEYIRISEYIEVEFPPLADDSIVEKQLAALDKAEQQLRNKFQEALNGIERHREELRAITYQAA